MVGNPTVNEIERRREAAIWLDKQGVERRGLSERQSAMLVHANLRSWESWVSDPAKDDHRKMPPAVWELYNLKLTLLELLAREQITAAEISRLGIHLPTLD